MPNASRTEEIQLWRSRLELAEAQLAEQTKRWHRTLQQYRGIFHPDEVDEDVRRDGVNHTLSVLGRTLPRLYYRDPTVIPSPRLNDPVIIEGAKGIRIYLEQQMRRLRLGRETKKILLDTFLYSEGYAKVGYQAVFEESGDKKEQIGADLPAFPEGAGLDDRAMLLKKGNLKGIEVAFDERLKSEELYILRVHPGHVLHDPDALEPSQAKWMAHIVPKRLEDLQGSRVYNPSVVSMLTPDAVTKGMGLGGQPALSSTDIDPKILEEFSQGFVRVIEIWDRESGRLLVMAPNTDDYLRDPRDWPYKMRGFPLKRLQFNMDPESWWSQPDVEAWIPMMEDLNFYRAKRRHRIKMNVSKMIADSTALDDEGKDALKSEVEQDLVMVNPSDAKPRDVIARVDPAGSPPDIGIAEAREKEDLSNVSGMSQQRRGVQGTYTTATEASIIEVATQEFEADRLSTVREFQQDLVESLLSLSRQYKTIPEIVGTAGPEGFLWYEVGDKIIEHPYDVEIQIGSSRYIPEEQLLAGKQMFFGLMAQTGFQFGDPVQLLRDIAELLRFNDVDRYVPDPADPEGLKRLAFLQAYRGIMGIVAPQVPGQEGQGGEGNGQGNPMQAMMQGGIAGSPNAAGGPGDLAAMAGQGAPQ